MNNWRDILAWRVQTVVTGEELGKYLDSHQLWRCMPNGFLFYVDRVVEIGEPNCKMFGNHDVVLRDPDNRLTPEEFSVTAFHEYNIPIVNIYELLATGDWPEVLYDIGMLTRESSLKLGWQVRPTGGPFKRGDKVIPVSKSSGRSWEQSIALRNMRELGQDFLYVIDYDDKLKVYICDEGLTTWIGDQFLEFDLERYYN